MADELRWRFEMTRAALPTLQQHLEWALQRQNRRIVQALPTDRMPIERRARLATLVSIAGLAVLLALYLLDPRAARRSPAFFVVIGLAFLGGLVAARSLPRIRAWSRRTAGAMLVRQAERLIAAVARRAPYTIEYRLADDQLVAHVETPRLDRRLDLRKAALVLHADNVLFVFRRRHSARPFRFVYVPGDLERDAVLAAFTRCGAATEELVGATEGYVPPIAPARVHRA